MLTRGRRWWQGGGAVHVQHVQRGGAVNVASHQAHTVAGSAEDQIVGFSSSCSSSRRFVFFGAALPFFFGLRCMPDLRSTTAAISFLRGTLVFSFFVLLVFFAGGGVVIVHPAAGAPRQCSVGTSPPSASPVAGRRSHTYDATRVRVFDGQQGAACPLRPSRRGDSRLLTFH